MYCDYQTLAEYAITLSNSFNKIKNSLNKIEEYTDNVVNYSTWNSMAREYFNQEFSEMRNNIDNIELKFKNINQYIDTVIDNYMYVEQYMATAFGGTNG